MTLQEFSVQFDVLYNNITSNQAPGLNEYEKSVFLTKAQNELIKNHFLGTGGSQGSFDSTAKRQYDFSVLIKQGEMEFMPVRWEEKFDPRSLVYAYPLDCFFVLNEHLFRNNRLDEDGNKIKHTSQYVFYTNGFKAAKLTGDVKQNAIEMLAEVIEAEGGQQILEQAGQSMNAQPNSGVENTAPQESTIRDADPEPGVEDPDMATEMTGTSVHAENSSNESEGNTNTEETTPSENEETEPSDNSEETDDPSDTTEPSDEPTDEPSDEPTDDSDDEEEPKEDRLYHSPKDDEENDSVVESKLVTPIYTIVPLHMYEYNRLMAKPYKYPLKYQVWRLMVSRVYTRALAMVYVTRQEEGETTPTTQLLANDITPTTEAVFSTTLRRWQDEGSTVEHLDIPANAIGQAGQSMLAQANQKTMGVLDLLG